MKIVVVGYGHLFASLVEGCLASGHQVVGIFRVDKVRYCRFTNFFKDLLLPDKDKLLVNKYKLNDINANSVNSEQFRKILVKLNPDIVLVASWCERFSLETIKIPKLATINTHPSLLPRYRGPNPYAQAIKHGETQTGLTFHIMDKDYDTGAILHQKIIPISKNETGESLRLKASIVAKDEIQNLLYNLDNSFITPINQEQKYASYQHQLSFSDAIINFQFESSEQIERATRAYYPWLKRYIPCINEFFSFKKIIVIDEYTNKHAGEILENDGYSVKIATIDKKIIQFNELEPVRFVLPCFYKRFVKSHLKTGFIAK